jgi:O-antigen ligase
VLPQFGIGLAFLGWLYSGIVEKHWNVRWHPFFIPYLFYIGWNILSAAFSVRPFHSLWAIVDNEWLALMMVMMFFQVTDEKALDRITTVLLVASIIPLAYSIWQVFGGVELYYHKELAGIGRYHQAIGFHDFHLTFAAFAAMIFLLSLSYSFEISSKYLWIFVDITIFSFLGLIATGARSFWLAFVLIIPLFGFMRSKKIGLFATGMLVAIAATMLVTIPEIRQRAVSIVDPTNSSNSDRLMLWKTAIRMTEDRPLLGFGQDNWDFFYPTYRLQDGPDLSHPHDDYFNVLVCSGLPGLAAFVSMWIIALWTGLKAWRRARSPHLRAIASGATLALLAFLLGSVFQNYYGTFLNCLEWWFIAGLIFTVDKLTKSQGTYGTDISGM